MSLLTKEKQFKPTQMNKNKTHQKNTQMTKMKDRKYKDGHVYGATGTII